MNQKTLQHFRRKLLDEKSKYNNILNMMKYNENGEQDKDTAGELSNYDNHPADLGTLEYQFELNNSLKVSDEDNLRKINDALDRIEKGTYGLCEICGKEISKERLETLPFALKCIVCAKENTTELETDSVVRPVEEKVIDAPFGRKYLNEQEDDEYEGKDYLNDLSKYGSSDTSQDMGGYHDYEEYYTNEVDNQGSVENTDNISNDDYEKQLYD